MHSKSITDRHLAAAFADFSAAVPGGINLDDIPLARRMWNALAMAKATTAPDIPGVTTSDHDAPGKDGPSVKVRIYQPEKRNATLPALLWIHGGGWILGDIHTEDLRAKSLSSDLNCVVASVEYRLAPEHPFPAALEDCYAALRWLANSAEQFGVNAERIAVGGESAGGNLAAGLCLMARDRAEVRICYQFLNGPPLDDMGMESSELSDMESPVLTRAQGMTAWRSYLHQKPGSEDISAYAAPVRAANLSGLPPTCISIGARDLLCIENLVYAQRLIKAGVSTELHVYAESFHGFDMFAPQADASKRCLAEYKHLLYRALHGY
ncbi:MAG: alpha/beta hydrolase [Desulfatitalea sp.]|nr:alpha/beta hydrolase [Desulfatitalea sp.]NNJ99651.1 alpha/beta hydrolase [Desulfatitalea sp.]